MKRKNGLYPQIFQFNVVPPQDGGFSLTPVESVIRGFRNPEDTMVLEIAGVDQVLFYGIRTNNYQAVKGMMMSHFPQAILGESVRSLVSGSYVEDQELAVSRQGDWLFLDEDELALVQTVYLEYESYLPLRVAEDREIRESEIDPLAGVVGLLAGSTSGEGTDGRGSDRFGVRIVARPADERWGQSWQNRMQDRRDGEDRNRHLPQGEGPSVGTLVALAGGGGLLLGNYLAWQNDLLPYAIAGDVAAVLGLAGYAAFQRGASGRRKRRPYIDERLSEEKLKALSYHCELQVVRVYRHPKDRELMLEQIRRLVDGLRAFDNSAGNAWKPGKLYEFDGQDVFKGALDHPFRGGLREVGMLAPGQGEKCILSARELASVWHLPLGRTELASMERASSVVLLPYTPELNKGGPEAGPMVGKAGRETLDVYLPQTAMAKHTLILGKSGTGKSTTLKHVLAHKFMRKAQGLDDDAIVVIDPHSDLVHELLELVPPEAAHLVRLLDFGRIDRVPAMNLVDPELFPDRDRCVDTIIQTVKGLWIHWGTRLEDLLRRSLTMVYEFNQHEDTSEDEMLTMLDILPILEGGNRVGQGRDAHYELGDFQRHVLSRVNDPRLHQWMEHNFLRWDPGERAQAVAPVNSRVGYYAQNLRASVVMGQRKSTILMSEVLEKGQILLVATASGAVGKDPAALMGGTVVSLIDSAIRSQESIEPGKRKKCLLVCDEFQTVTGADWESMLAEDRKYGLSMMLATQSLLRLDTGERRLQEGVLGNIGCFIAYKMSAGDALIVSREMERERVAESNFVSLHPHHCYVKIDTDSKSFPAFSMRSMPPPGRLPDAEETLRAVMEQSEAYTVDWEESRRRIEADVKAQMQLQGGGESMEEVPFASKKDRKGGRKKGGASSNGGGEGHSVPAVGDVFNGTGGMFSVELEASEPVAAGVVEMASSSESVSLDGGAGRSEQANGVGAGASWLSPGAMELVEEEDGAAFGQEPERAESGAVGVMQEKGVEESPETHLLDGLSGSGSLFAEASGEGSGPDVSASLGEEELPGDSGREGDGGGGSAGDSGRRRKKKNAFDDYGRSPTPVIGESSPLRNVRSEKVEGSVYTREALERLVQNADDPGVRAVFDKIFTGMYSSRMAKEYKRGRREALEELREAQAAEETAGDGPSRKGGRAALLDATADRVLEEE